MRHGDLVTRVPVEESWPHKPHQLCRCPWKRDLGGVQLVLIWRWQNRRQARSKVPGRCRSPNAPCAASRSPWPSWYLTAARHAPTSAGTARMLGRARSAGLQPVRHDTHIPPRRTPAPLSQAPRKCSPMRRRPSRLAEYWNWQNTPESCSHCRTDTPAWQRPGRNRPWRVMSQAVPVNDDPRRYEMAAASAAPRSQQESRPLRRVTNADSGFAASGRPATPGDEDTPVYWQTVQAMASGSRRADGTRRLFRP